MFVFSLTNNLKKLFSLIKLLISFLRNDLLNSPEDNTVVF